MKKLNIKKIVSVFIPFIIPIIFFNIAIFTISDYGMNWDSPIHFARGQAFLRYFLTGKTDYKALKPLYCLGKDGFNSRVDYKTGEVCNKHRKARVSEYQHRELDFNFFKKDIYGHPPLSDVFSAITNQIFYIKLGWLEDIEAYHLFNIFTGFLLSLVVSVWAKKAFGNFAAVIAGLVVCLFPLLLGEQHFNVKDPSMAAFFTLSLYLFWLSIVEKKSKYMYFSAIAGGISFATKFNYLFAPFILVPWLIIYFGSFFKEIIHNTGFRIKKIVHQCWKKVSKGTLIALILYPFIVFAIFYFSWPVLWSDPINNVKLVFKFYKDVGTSGCGEILFSPGWFLHCSDPLAIEYFIYTIPVVSLIFFFIGFLIALGKWKRNGYVTVLWLSFLILTILRVTFFGAIYGGVRQIMEFIAPTAMIAGLGAVSLRNFLFQRLVIFKHFSRYKKSNLNFGISFLMLCCFIPISLKIISMHPNENLYFNSLIGGLKGAVEKKIPYVPNTFGNGLFQGIQWLNKYAEKNAKISLVSGLGQNISRGTLRGDFSFQGNANRSGYYQAGEYGVLLIAQGDPTVDYFRYKFFDKFLDPIYVIKVDDVPILKIWKNEPKYVKKRIDIKGENFIESTIGNDKDGNILITLQSLQKLKRLEANFKSKQCSKALLEGTIFTSVDGKQYDQIAEHLDDPAHEEIKNYNADATFLFTGENSQFIKIQPVTGQTCNSADVDFSAYGFSHL